MLKDSEVLAVRLDGGGHEIIDSVVSAFHLNLASGGNFLVSGLGASRGDGPSILDLGFNKVSTLLLDGTDVEEWSLGITGGSVTIEDSTVSYLLSDPDSDVTVSRSEMGTWELRGTGRVAGSEIETLVLNSSQGTPIWLSMTDTLVERLETTPFSDGRVPEGHIICDGCQIVGSIILRDADFLLEGDILIQVPESNVIWKNSRVTRLYSFEVIDEDGRPMAGVSLRLTTNGVSGLVGGVQSEDAGRAVFELRFFDSDWSRTEIVSAADDGQEGRGPLTFLGSTPIAIMVPSSGPAVSIAESKVSTGEDVAGSGFLDCMVRVLGSERVNDIFVNRVQVNDEDRDLIEGKCFEHLFTSNGEPVIQVLAHIDGRSQLAIRGDTVQWLHFDQAAPGREALADLPTIVNGVEWTPEWPDNDSAENRDCGCSSSIFRDLEPALAADDVSVELEVLRARGEVFIAETPTVGNNYTLVIEFNDDPQSGPDRYEVKIRYKSPATTEEVVLESPATSAEASTPVTATPTEGGLRRGATISGRVVSAATGLPLTRIRLVAFPAKGDGTDASMDTDADGRYTLTGLAPGSYRVRAEGNR